MPLNPEDDMEASAPQTESARERGFKVDVPSRRYGATTLATVPWNTVLGLV